MPALPVLRSTDTKHCYRRLKICAGFAAAFLFLTSGSARAANVVFEVPGAPRYQTIEQRVRVKFVAQLTEKDAGFPESELLGDIVEGAYSARPMEPCLNCVGNSRTNAPASNLRLQGENSRSLSVDSGLVETRMTLELQGILPYEYQLSASQSIVFGDIVTRAMTRKRYFEEIEPVGLERLNLLRGINGAPEFSLAEYLSLYSETALDELLTLPTQINTPVATLELKSSLQLQAWEFGGTFNRLSPTFGPGSATGQLILHSHNDSAAVTATYEVVSVAIVPEPSTAILLLTVSAALMPLRTRHA